MNLTILMLRFSVRQLEPFKALSSLGKIVTHAILFPYDQCVCDKVKCLFVQCAVFSSALRILVSNSHVVASIAVDSYAIFQYKMGEEEYKGKEAEAQNKLHK